MVYAIGVALDYRWRLWKMVVRVWWWGELAEWRVTNVSGTLLEVWADDPLSLGFDPRIHRESYIICSQKLYVTHYLFSLSHFSHFLYITMASRCVYSYLQLSDD
jgi:hypothetical protein